MTAPKQPVRDVITIEHAEQHRQQLQAINDLGKEFHAFQEVSKKEHQHLREIIEREITSVVRQIASRSGVRKNVKLSLLLMSGRLHFVLIVPQVAASLP
jgi:hypothetical protein